MSDASLETRAKILSVARTRFATKGYYGTSVDSIVTGTGLSKGAIYWHFSGKWDIYKSVLNAEAERIKDLILPRNAAILDAPAFLSDRGKLLIDEMIADTECRLLWIRIGLESIGDNSEIKGLVSSLSNSMISDFVAILGEKWKDEREILSLRSIVAMFEFIMHGIILNIGVSVSAEEAKQSWEFLVRRLFGGKD